MKQISTGAPAQKSPFHARAHAATVADIRWPPVTTVSQHDHLAAAAYLMKHAGTAALIVADAQTGQPAGITTAADIARATADGKDANGIWASAAMATRPAITTTTTIRDAATIMTATHHHHLPANGDTGLLGAVDITGVCQALTRAGQEQPQPRVPNQIGQHGQNWCAHHRRPGSARPPALPCPQP